MIIVVIISKHTSWYDWFDFVSSFTYNEMHNFNKYLILFTHILIYLRSYTSGLKKVKLKMVKTSK